MHFEYVYPADQSPSCQSLSKRSTLNTGDKYLVVGAAWPILFIHVGTFGHTQYYHLPMKQPYCRCYCFYYCSVGDIQIYFNALQCALNWLRRKFC